MTFIEQISLISLIFGLLFSQTLLANQNRVALVIGNSNYKDSPLANPVNDARLMSDNLKKLGFQVILKTNANQEMMDSAIEQFGQKLKEGSVGLFFYAGHGVQSKGRNYLIPVNARLNKEKDLKYRAVDAGNILDEMGGANNGLNIVILDACRNNPLERSFRRGSRGLSRMDDVPAGTLLAYSTAPQKVAADGDGRNSPYTKALVQAMNQPGRPLELVFKDTLKQVKKTTRGKQIPWFNSSVEGDFYFSGAEQNSQTPTKIASVDPDMASNDEREFWSDVNSDPSKAIYEAYLDAYPSGKYASRARIKLKKYQSKADKTGHLTIRSNVLGDTVTLNGKNYGSTRLDLTLTVGEYELIISKSGYEDYTKPLQIRSGSNQTIQGHLNREGDNLSAYGIEMVSIQGGSFQMGSPSNEKNRKSNENQHSVRVSAFKLMAHEVTRGQFRSFVNETGYRTDAEKNTGGVKGCVVFKTGSADYDYASGYDWQDPNYSQYDNHPVVCVSWNDATAYAKWLNRKTGKHFRLPTEAEWEYAARGGKSSAFYWGNDTSYSQICRYGNGADKATKRKYSGWAMASCDDSYVYTAPKKSFKPNAYGLYDMSGNVFEWTCSSYSKSYDGSEKRCSNGSGGRTLRDGSWYSSPFNLRSAVRNWTSPGHRDSSLGFRLAQDI